MGEAPDWWFHVRAARYLGVSPWDLAGQPVFWRNVALISEDVEAQFQQDMQRREQSRSGG